MKNFFLKSTLLLSLVFGFYSCNNENASNSEGQLQETSKVSTVGLITSCEDCEVSESRTYFYCGINAEASYIDNDNPFLNEIQESIANEIPVKIYFDEEQPNKIISIVKISTAEEKEWKKNRKIEDHSLKSIEELNEDFFSQKALTYNFTTTEAVTFFNNMKNSSCAINNQYLCIPFQYANDGCYARAHMMRKHMNYLSKDCYKIFAYGNLKVNTSNSGTCTVKWRYHVAPVVNVSGVWNVIDPSLFNQPVTINTWLNKMKFNGGTVSVVRYQTSRVYYYDYASNYTQYDDNYSDTYYTLDNYRYLQTVCY